MNLTPIQKLDVVLGIVAQNTNYEPVSIIEIVHRAREKIKAPDVDLVLKKLAEDNHVKSVDLYASNESYNSAKRHSITFNGLLFNQQGGYSAEDENKKKKTRKDTAYTLAVAVGTVLAGIYTVFEITQWVFHHFRWRLPF